MAIPAWMLCLAINKSRVFILFELIVKFERKLIFQKQNEIKCDGRSHRRITQKWRAIKALACEWLHINYVKLVSSTLPLDIYVCALDLFFGIHLAILTHRRDDIFSIFRYEICLVTSTGWWLNKWMSSGGMAKILISNLPSTRGRSSGLGGKMMKLFSLIAFRGKFKLGESWSEREKKKFKFIPMVSSNIES
jgi:hypothetical protein